MNYSSLQKAAAIPGAAAMIETFRAIGYSLETAVADIIDNSISAEAIFYEKYNRYSLAFKDYVFNYNDTNYLKE